MNILKQLKNETKKLMKQHDSAHNFDHIMRVYKNAEMLCTHEKANKKLVLSAVLLHDIISYPKSYKISKLSSTKSSILAQKILKKHNFTLQEIQLVSNAIEDHSFSKNRTPKTLEGKILQDADRLDAIGAIGIARAFSVGGYEKRSFYNNFDPFCIKRNPNDKIWTLDHFYKKLLLLEKNMNTKTAKIEAKRRTKILKKFLADLKKEI